MYHNGPLANLADNHTYELAGQFFRRFGKTKQAVNFVFVKIISF